MYIWLAETNKARAFKPGEVQAVSLNHAPLQRQQWESELYLQEFLYQLRTCQSHRHLPRKEDLWRLFQIQQQTDSKEEKTGIKRKLTKVITEEETTLRGGKFFYTIVAVSGRIAPPGFNHRSLA